jgi:hypothetical protein
MKFLGNGTIDIDICQAQAVSRGREFAGVAAAKDDNDSSNSTTSHQVTTKVLAYLM